MNNYTFTRDYSKNEEYTKPERLTPQILAFWSPAYKRVITLDGGPAMVTKAKKLVELKLVKSSGLGTWDILPIKGYNKTQYKILSSDGQLSCNCQGFSKYGNRCSHTLAVEFWEEIENNIMLEKLNNSKISNEDYEED